MTGVRPSILRFDSDFTSYEWEPHTDQNRGIEGLTPSLLKKGEQLLDLSLIRAAAVLTDLKRLGMLNL